MAVGEEPNENLLTVMYRFPGLSFQSHLLQFSVICAGTVSKSTSTVFLFRIEKKIKSAKLNCKQLYLIISIEKIYGLQGQYVR
jgi:hypothetical protein